MTDFFIIAGEASGDLHAASLVRSISSLCPESRFSGIGGKEMRSAGVDTVFDMNEVNFIGFTSVIKNIGTIKAHMNRTVELIRESDPAAVILVDFPGYNLRIAERIRKFYKGVIIYYIAPQVWAWHKSRVKIMERVIDELIVVFPFEVGFFKQEGIRAEYAGHPLMKRIGDFLSAAPRRSNTKKIISFLPGSRKGEIDSILPVMIDSGKLLRDKYDCILRLLCAPHIEEAYYRQFPGTEDFEIVHEPSDPHANYRSMLDSDLIITKSGTSTLECALIGTPFIVVYKTGPLNYAIGRMLVDVKYISIVNILLDRPAVKEFLQDKMTPGNIAEEAERILEDQDYTSEMKMSFAELKDILGSSDASLEAARLICSKVKIAK